MCYTRVKWEVSPLLYLIDKFDKLDELEDEFHDVDKLDCYFGELDKLNA